MLNKLEDAVARAEALVRPYLDPFPVEFTVVPSDALYEIAAYGTINHWHHWSYGRDYWLTRDSMEHGYNRLYEVVLNANPARAYLLDSNQDSHQGLIAAHVFGHCLVPGTLVVTKERGVTTIEAVEEGEHAMTRYGTFAECHPTACHYVGDVVTMQVGNEEVQATVDHQFLVKQDDGTVEWRRAEDIRVGDCLVMPRPAVGRGEQERWYDYTLSELFGWFVGVWLASGGVGGRRSSIEVLLNDRERVSWGRAYEACVATLFGQTVQWEAADELRTWRAVFEDKAVQDWLSVTGLWTGVEHRHLPWSLVEQAPAVFLRGVLLGYLDSQGRLVPEEAEIVFAAVSPVLVAQMNMMAAVWGMQWTGRALLSSEIWGFVWHLGRKQLNGLQGLLRIPGIEALGLVAGGERLAALPGWTVMRWDREAYEGMVHCLNVPESESFMLASGVVAHNSHVFKNNIHFANTRRDMPTWFGLASERIRRYDEQVGMDRVETFLDWVMSIRDQVSVYTPQVLTRVTPTAQYADLLGRPADETREDALSSGPWTLPDLDLLRFLYTYAPFLEDWQRDILDMVRTESLYFRPQLLTKVLNEGFATWVHQRSLAEMADTWADAVDMSSLHAGVTARSSLTLNPYWLGWRLFQLIERDEGVERVLALAAEESDASLIRTWLRDEYVEELDLYTYAWEPEQQGVERAVREWRDPEQVRTKLANSLAAGGPRVYVANVAANWCLDLAYNNDASDLDPHWSPKALQCVANIWGGSVRMLRGGNVLWTAEPLKKK